MPPETQAIHVGTLDLAYRRIKNAIRPGVIVEPAPSGVEVDWNVPVTVRDGTVLRANVFRPPGGEPAPAIVCAHPYNKDAIPAKTRSGKGVSPQYHAFPQPEIVRLSAWTSWEAPDPARLVPHGYAVVNVDLRGGGKSEGEDELFSDQEAEDYYDVIEWVGTQPWCSGRVGLEGVSYLAISQYKVAALRPPHLCAICPWEGFSDIYRDFARPGGVLEKGFSILWCNISRRAARLRGDPLEELQQRESRDEWYQAHTPILENIEVPMLVCGSFSDHSLHSRGSFEAFRRSGSHQKWLFTHRSGKWSTYYSDEAREVRLRFFDHFLKGDANGWDQEPPVRLAVYEGGPTPAAVVSETEWPPADLDWREIYLNAADRTLQAEPPEHEADASFSTPGGRLQFTWTAEEDRDWIGPIALHLFVELKGIDDANLFVGLRKFSGGREVAFEGSYGFSGDMVTRGWLRLAHRDLDESLSTPWMPVHTHQAAKPVAEGEIIEAKIALLPHATRLRRGECLRLDIRGSWLYPQDPLRGQFPVNYARSQTGTCIVHTGPTHPSRLFAGSRNFKG